MTEPAPAPAPAPEPAPRVVSVRRYPVKSMGGESLTTVPLDARGLVGDRAFAVRDADNRLASGKNTRRMVRRDGIFAYSAATGADGVVTVADADGPVGIASDPSLDDALSTALGAAVRVAPETDVRHFDDGAVSLVGTATLAWCGQHLGADADPRRLRVNLVVETSEPFEEEGWIGATLTIGGAVLAPVGRIERCRTIDIAQDGVTTPTRWLKPLGEQRDLSAGVYCDVTTLGTVRVGDAVIVALTTA